MMPAAAGVLAAAARRAHTDPAAFWGAAAEAVQWCAPFTQVLDDSKTPFTKWFVGGKVNTCYNALDVHVKAGRGKQAALIYDSPVTKQLQTYTYEALLEEVAKFATVLTAQGVGVGDRVLVYMPMIPQAVVAMLACARIGAIHSVVFGGFASRELAVRISDAKPKVIVAGSCGVEPSGVLAYKPLLDDAIDQSGHTPGRVIMVDRPQGSCASSMQKGRDVFYHDLMSDNPGAAPPVSVDSSHPLYVIYTSGSTGTPKGVVRDNGGHAVAMKWSLKNVFGAKPGEIFWAASDYTVYAPLLSGCTTVLYEGKPVGTPNAAAFWRVVRQHNVDLMFTAPTALRAIRKEDPDGELMRKEGGIGKLRTLFVAGERSDPSTVQWAQDTLNIPVVDNYWQTETGWPIVSNCLGIEPIPVRPGSAGKAVPGYDVRILDPSLTPDEAHDHNHVHEGELPEAKRNQLGPMVVKLPLPPGTLMSLWQDDARFLKSYMDAFPGYYHTGDAAMIDDDGYFHIMGRTDDVMNVAGHRLSTGAIEAAIATHPAVAECAVVGAADKLKGQVPIALVVFKSGAQHDRHRTFTEIRHTVRENVGRIASLAAITDIARLPKTRSGKTLRSTIRAIADSAPYRMPATIDDPTTLVEVKTALLSIGYAGHSSTADAK